MPTYVALLRGINLGATRRVAMSDLRSLLEGLGYADVRTHLQSGNAVFRAPARSAAAVETAVSRAIAAELGLDVAVVARTAAQLAAVVAADPFGAVAKDPARYLVTFLGAPPPADWLASLDPDSHAPDRLVADGRQLYLWLPGGVHSSRLAKAVAGKRLGSQATSRNWNVVTALTDLAAATCQPAGRPGGRGSPLPR